MKRENEKLTLKNEKLMENTVIARVAKYIEIPKHENVTLYKVLNITFKGIERLGLLVKGRKHPFDKHGLGLKSLCKLLNARL